MNNKKLLLIAIVAIVVLVGLGTGLTLLQRKPTQTVGSTTQSSQSSTVNSGANSISVDFSSVASTVNGDAQYSIRGNIYHSLQQSVKNPTSSYRGSIRQNSYATSMSAQGLPIKTFLIDIPSAGLTYQVKITGDNTTAFHTIYVLCAPAAQQISHSTECKSVIE